MRRDMLNDDDRYILQRSQVGNALACTTHRPPSSSLHCYALRRSNTTAAVALTLNNIILSCYIIIVRRSVAVIRARVRRVGWGSSAPRATVQRERTGGWNTKRRRDPAHPGGGRATETLRPPPIVVVIGAADTVTTTVTDCTTTKPTRRKADPPPPPHTASVSGVKGRFFFFLDF